LDSQRTFAIQALINDLTQEQVTDAEWLARIQSVTRDLIIEASKLATLNNGFFLSGVTEWK